MPKLDIYVVDTNGNPLEGAFVSCSAGSEFMKDVTNEAGLIKFSDLNPQTYYLTAILKEYQFGKASAVTVSDEQHAKATIKGERVAFSVFGALQSIQGQKYSEGSHVIAVGADKTIEKAKVNPDGSFRLMGL